MRNLVNKIKLFYERGKIGSVGKGVWIHYSARLNGDRCINLDDDVIICRGASLSGKIKIGARTRIEDFSILHTWGGEIEIGQDCSINPFCMIYGHGGLKIGSGVRIATHVIIAPVNHIYKDRQSPIWKQGISSKGIVIEDDIWIGSGAIILDGVRIGKGTVIAAGAVVTDEVLPFQVVAGVPARKIKER